ncbi:transmembrane protein 114 [Engraulis encrasicolus]|uniref:transmembrane protein 114 n=1 Tax=Engraulis encrasicolus TaxID=184585 RepID=UPI002FD2618E
MAYTTEVLTESHVKSRSRGQRLATRLSLRCLSRFMVVLGLLSFVCLLVAIGTDYWYIINVSEHSHNFSASQSSHTGLWRVCHYESQCRPLVNPFKSAGNLTLSQMHIINLRAAFLLLLPLSVMIMVVSSVLGVIGLLARAHRLLLVTASLLMFGAMTTLSGVCTYVAYSTAGYREAVRLLLAQSQGGSKALLEHVDIRFGWSLALACLSLVGETLTGIALLAAAWRLSHGRAGREDQGL